MIDRLEVVSSFDLDETILLTAGREIQRVRAKRESRVIQLNVPDAAPPELPRMVLRTKGFVLNVCQNRFQFIVSPPDHVAGSYVETMAYLERQVREPLADLYGDNLQYSWTGVIAALKYPRSLDEVSTGLEASAPVFKKLINLDWDPAALASFSLKVGRKSRGFFHTFELTGYEMRTYELKGTLELLRKIKIERDAGELQEVGLQVLVDVNNKPSPKTASPEEDFVRILKEHKEVFYGLSESLNLAGVI